MTEKTFSRNSAISLLTKSAHGALKEYVEGVRECGTRDPEFLARLTAWNLRNGKIRDAKIALSVASLEVLTDAELRENALACFGSLSPREMVRGMRFAYELPKVSNRSLAMVARKRLEELESSPRKFARVALQHKKSLQEMYALSHTKAGEQARSLVFGRGEATLVSKLASMSAEEAAGTILEHRIPFLTASGALGKRAADPTIALALLEVMTPTEVVTNAKRLEKLGVRTVPSLRGKFEEKIGEVGRSTAATLKTTRAAEAIGDTEVGEKLRAAQDRQLNSISVEGDWLVLGDKSGSMSLCIEAARHVSATLARVAKGKVMLSFFDTSVTSYDVTGKSYEEILQLSRFIKANGGTSIGAGIAHAQGKGFIADGIVIVTDGQENGAPFFAHAYPKYCEFAGKDIPVYVYLIGSAQNTLAYRTKDAGISLEVFDITSADFYSLPNLIATMRTNRFALSDEIMQTPLLRLADIFKQPR